MAVDHKSCRKILLVEIGKGKGSYEVKYSFCRHEENRALVHYNSLNTHSGHKKRLVLLSKGVHPRTVLARVLT